MMADKSGTFALFTFTSNTEDMGRRNSESESEAEGVEPGAGVRVQIPGMFAFLGPQDWNHRHPCLVST